MRGAGGGHLMRMRDVLLVGLMLFGLFFGAGNSIFPVSMGQLAGREWAPAFAGFAVTAVGLPVAGVAALAAGGASGPYELASRVGKRYARFFSSALYLCVGPLFAVPRCASVPYELGVAPLLAPLFGEGDALLRVGFSTAFFAAAFFLSLRSNRLLTVVGKVLTPLFAVSLVVLCVAAFADLGGSGVQAAPQGAYAGSPLSTGLLEGSKSMDVLASLAFGTVVVAAARDRAALGSPAEGAREGGVPKRALVEAGAVGGLLMAAAYGALALLGAESRSVFEAAPNGGAALGLVARHCLGEGGQALLTAVVVLACLKCAVGLLAACAEGHRAMFRSRLGYVQWLALFAAVSYALSLVGLNEIVALSVPVLSLLYPPAIALIFVTLVVGRRPGMQAAYRWTTAFAFAAALFDLLAALPEGVQALAPVAALVDGASAWLPLYGFGLGWVVPTLAGFAVGLFASKRARARART